ncbi:MAG: hypothetical protein NZ703_08050, partial [Gemmataceae bacterium]|nr:hypothetical protein [Gemmataceae bacterium]
MSTKVVFPGRKRWIWPDGDATSRWRKHNRRWQVPFSKPLRRQLWLAKAVRGLVIIGVLLVTVILVGHGCHLDDHDDE